MDQGSTGIRRGGLVATLVCATMLFGVGATASASTFKGKTTQDLPFNLTVNKAGIPSKAVYSWDMDCKDGGALTNGSTLSAKFAGATAEGFKSRGSYNAEVERRYEAEVAVRIKGDRASETRFTGSFKLKAKVVEEETGEMVARCKTGLVRWTADLKGGPVPPPATPSVPRFRG